MNKKPSQKNLRFAVIAADNAFFTVKDGSLHVRLISLASHSPFPGKMGLPGGLIAPEETAEESALRHIEAKAKIGPGKVYTEQLYTFSKIGRDPRGRVIAVAYLGLVPWDELDEKEKKSEDGAHWVPVAKLPELGYDHNDIINAAVDRLRSRISYTTIASGLLPREFTLMELEKTYETILGRKMDRRNFRKKLKKLDILKPLGKKRTGGKWRPAMLYSFRSPKVQNIEMI